MVISNRQFLRFLVRHCVTVLSVECCLVVLLLGSRVSAMQAVQPGWFAAEGPHIVIKDCSTVTGEDSLRRPASSIFGAVSGKRILLRNGV